MDEVTNPKATKQIEKVAAKNSDDLAQELIQHNLAAKKKIIDDAIADGILNKSNKVKGNFGEMVCDYEFLSKQFTINGRTGTFKRISKDATESLDDPIRKGIDGIYEFSNPPPKYVVNESKFGKSSLSRTVTASGGTQMTERWIEWLLRDLPLHQYKDVMKHGYESVVTRVAKDGKVSYSKLNKDAKVVNKYWPI